MSEIGTKKMLKAYRDNAPTPLFFAGLFQTPASNFFKSESVEIDIERDSEDVAVAVTDLSVGYRANAQDIFTNKEFTPPIFKEKAVLNSFDLQKRMVGDDPFAAIDFQQNATVRALKSILKIQKKIRRAIELQASQVMQTGTATLTDASGAALFQIDYSPKPTHFPTAANPWTGAGDPLADIEGVSEIIRDDGLLDPDELYMGVGAFENFVRHADIKDRLDNRRMGLGGIVPKSGIGQGAFFRGTIEIGNYSYNIFTYGGKYKAIQGGATTPYMATDKCIVRASGGRFDGLYGAVPQIVRPDSRVLKYLPSRVSGSGMDMFTNAWVSEDNESISVGVSSRPLLVPTAIDTYGCISGLV